MKNYLPQVGDVIKVNCGVYWHVGVYVGWRAGDSRDVVHNDKNQGVIPSTLAEFSGGRPVMLHRQAVGDWHERKRIARRAIDLIGAKYDLWKFNCEHAASLAQTGKAESPQIAAFVFLACVVLGLVAFVRRK
jgi:Lecithin retinol acyltransferase